MQASLPFIRDLVLVGGGHTHALVLRRWAMAPMAGVRLTVIDPTPVTAYSGMLPGFVAGHYDMPDLEIDLVRLARFAGARLIIGPATAIDPEARRVTVPGRPPVHFDLASVDVGITARMPDLPGFNAHGVPAKPLGTFAQTWADFVEQVRAGVALPKVAMIGGGIAGVELALTMHHRLSTVSDQPVDVTVIDRGTALAGVSQRSRRVLLDQMHSFGITLLEHAEVAEVTADGVRLTDGTLIEAALRVGAAGATPVSWLGANGLAVEVGFVAVDEHLRSISHPSVFAAGDCAHLTASPRPKAGVFAVRAAPVLDYNLRAALSDRPTKPFKPQRSYLKLVSLGPKLALAQKGPFSFAAPAMWQLKDRIDRAFMKKVQDLPSMTAPDLPKDAPPALALELHDGQPMCGGCGAKVGPGPLAEALCALPAQTAEGLESTPGDDAAILRSGDGWQVISTDHLRAVTDDPEVMTRIALNHAMGDVWAMGARPQVALAQVVIPRMSGAMQARTLGEITQAAGAAAGAVGAALAGGHTTMGTEMTIGFTVTGLCDRPPVTKGGAQPGDILLLTRPIGSGTLLAAEMQMRAEGRWIADLMDLLCRDQAKEAAVLAPLAHGMTDITGFGLAGHALEMAQASGVGITLTMRDIPVLNGAAGLAAAGVRSTIHADNRAACIDHITARTEEDETALLFDPQTCGGLLAALPAKSAMEAVAAIAKSGGRAWAVGVVTEGPARLTID